MATTGEGETVASELKKQIETASQQLDKYVAELKKGEADLKKEGAQVEEISKQNAALQSTIDASQEKLAEAQNQLRSIVAFQKALTNQGVLKQLTDLQGKLEATLEQINAAEKLTAGRALLPPTPPRAAGTAATPAAAAGRFRPSLKRPAKLPQHAEQLRNF